MRSIPVPTILSESGRALASHHAIMVFDVLTRSLPPPPNPPALKQSMHQRLRTMIADHSIPHVGVALPNPMHTRRAGIHGCFDHIPKRALCTCE